MNSNRNDATVRRLGGSRWVASAFLTLASALIPISLPATEALRSDAGWEPATAERTAELLRAGFDQLGLSPDDAEELIDRAAGRIADGEDVVEVAGDAIATADVSLRTLWEQSSRDPLTVAAVFDPKAVDYDAIQTLPGTVTSTFRLSAGRELVRRGLYDEALPLLAEIDPSSCFDPAAVMFYRGACYHGLRMKKEAMGDLRKLLRREDDLPRRFARTAKMLVADIRSLEEGSLDDISRKMSDVRRRLDLGRSGQTVEGREQEVIDDLTKLIEELEQQQQQQQQAAAGGSSGGGGGAGDGSPAQESRLADASGKGDVDKKSLGDAGGWGNLPPAERQETLQRIGKELPTHYRDAIEAYFRRLAREG